MKCDELKWKWAYGPYLDPPEGQKESAIRAGYIKVVSKQEVDEAIAELEEFAEDACLERDDNQTAIDELQAENAELKRKLEDVQASMYCDVLDAGMENRRLKRALWLMRAYFCGRSSEYFSGMASCNIGQGDFYKELSERAQRYLKASYKCRTKAEKYK